MFDIAHEERLISREMGLESSLISNGEKFAMLPLMPLRQLSAQLFVMRPPEDGHCWSLQVFCISVQALKQIRIIPTLM